MPETVKAAQQAIDEGASVPLFADHRMKMYAVAPTPSYTELMPINRALMIAIEKLDLQSRQEGLG